MEPSRGRERGEAEGVMRDLRDLKDLRSGLFVVSVKGRGEDK